MRLLLLGTEGCHLCEEAAEIVAACAPDLPIAAIDIAEHTEWQEDYALKIPVLLDAESRRELTWPFDCDSAGDFLRQLKSQQSGSANK